MRQGTTPTLEYTLPFSTDDVKGCRVDFTQNGKLVLVKEGDECVLLGTKVSVILSEEETLKLNERELLEMQVEIKTSDDSVMRSRPITVKVGKALNKEVM